MSSQKNSMTLESESKDISQNIQHRPHFFDATSSDHFFDTLLRETPWSRDSLFMYGRKVDIPRYQAWYGDEGKTYTYSGLQMKPCHWTPCLLLVREQLENFLGETFNSVLLNRYRDGNDHVSWHSDDEPELGTDPAIASLSLGASRHFQMRHKKDPARRMTFLLAHGDLLVMRGSSQRDWSHRIPRDRRVHGARLNLTFRKIFSPALTRRPCE